MLTALCSGNSVYEQSVKEWNDWLYHDSDDEQQSQSDDDGRDDGKEEFYRLMRNVGAQYDDAWSVTMYESTYAPFSKQIAPGALPYGFRFLQFNDHFN